MILEKCTSLFNLFCIFPMRAKNSSHNRLPNLFKFSGRRLVPYLKFEWLIKKLKIKNLDFEVNILAVYNLCELYYQCINFKKN